MPRDKPMPDAGYLFFGDSFVRLFGLVNHPEIGVKGFKGASAKGLSKELNENRLDVLRILKTRPETQHIVFVFGNVDVHMSYYYCKYAREPPEEQDYDKIARGYVNFVASLPGKEGMGRTIVGVYPSSLIEPESVPESIAAYGVLTKEQAANINTPDCTLEQRQARVRAFNTALRAACDAEAAAGAAKVEYLDVFDEVMDPATLQLRPEYLDISQLNIHIVWETTILLWLEKLPWLKARTPRGFSDRMQQSLSRYLREKEAEFAMKGLSINRAHGASADTSEGAPAAVADTPHDVTDAPPPAARAAGGNRVVSGDVRNLDAGGSTWQERPTQQAPPPSSQHQHQNHDAQQRWRPASHGDRPNKDDDWQMAHGGRRGGRPQGGGQAHGPSASSWRSASGASSARGGGGGGDARQQHGAPPPSSTAWRRREAGVGEQGDGAWQSARASSGRYRPSRGGGGGGGGGGW